MALTAQDIEALRVLLREELTTREEFDELRSEVLALRSDMHEGFDSMSKKFETLETE